MKHLNLSRLLILIALLGCVNATNKTLSSNYAEENQADSSDNKKKMFDESQKWFLSKLNQYVKTQQFGIFTLTDFRFKILNDSLTITHKETKVSVEQAEDCIVSETVLLKDIANLVSENKNDLVFKTKQNAINTTEKCSVLRDGTTKESSSQKYKTNTYLNNDFSAEENLLIRLSSALERIQKSLKTKEAY